jgi:hypothetical protein
MGGRQEKASRDEKGKVPATAITGCQPTSRNSRLGKLGGWAGPGIISQTNQRDDVEDAARHASWETTTEQGRGGTVMVGVDGVFGDRRKVAISNRCRFCQAAPCKLQRRHQVSRFHRQWKLLKANELALRLGILDSERIRAWGFPSDSGHE